MKNTTLLALVLVSALAGCRREDIREFTVELPELAESSRKQVFDAFIIHKPGMPERVYEGIQPDSFVFDYDRKTLTMRYDSMKIAQTNIRMLLAEKGLKVVFPTNTTGIAGYLDIKPKSVER